MGDYQYYAFISYKREDESWAKWMQSKLEYFKLPSSTSEEKYIRPVFRDITDLRPGLLSERICDALDQSKYLIAICSPNYSKSKWCDAEIRRFIETGRTEYIIPFIIDGKPYADDERECFPPSLRELRGSVSELLGADIRTISSDFAFIQVVSCMLNLNVDSLWKRYLKNEEEEKRKLKENNDHLLYLQSRIVAEKAKELLENWPYDREKAAALALNVLPNDINYPNRPWVLEAEYVLRQVFTPITEKVKVDDIGKVLCYNKDVAIVYGGDIDQTIRVYDLKTGIKKSVLGNDKIILDATLSLDSSLLATRSGEIISLWDLRSGCLISSRCCHKSDNKILSFSKDNKLLIEASQHFIEIWNVANMERICLYQAHDGKITSLNISPDNCCFITSSLDHTVKIWKIDGSSLVYSAKFDSIVTCSCFSKDGSLVMISLDEGEKGKNTTKNTIQIIDYRENKTINSFVLSGNSWFINKICYSKGFSYAIIEDSSSIYMFDIESGVRIFKIPDVKMMKMSDDGTAIQYVSVGNSVKQANILSRQFLLEDAMNKVGNYPLSVEDKKEYYLI